MIGCVRTNANQWAAAIVVAALGMVPLKGHPDDEIVDFSDQLVPVCNVLGLLAKPPADWFAVPMEGLPEQLAGCQMMRTGPTEELVGIIRVSASRVRDGNPGTDSRQRHLLFEIEVLRNMGIVLDLEDPLWSRDSVPLADVSAAGFSNAAQAVGYRAVIAETQTLQEVHVLTFHGPSTQYALVLITPPRFKEAEIYQRNTTDFGRVLGTLDVGS